MAIYSKKDAFLLGRKDTIDIKYLNAKEYVNKIEGKSSKFYLIKSYMKNTLAICGIIWFILVVLFGWDILIPEKANANAGGENLGFLARFPENEKVVIGCYNDKTQKARPGEKCTQGGDHNIVLPPKTHIGQWLKVFNPYETTNRLAIVNFESNFRENASNSHAKGYVQTLRKWNIQNDIVSQLTWVKNRQVDQKKVYSGKSKRCGYFWENNNEKDGFTLGEYGVLSCLYRYHYHATKGTAYAKRGIEATLYYKWYMFSQGGEDWETYRDEMYEEIILK